MNALGLWAAVCMAAAAFMFGSMVGYDAGRKDGKAAERTLQDGVRDDMRGLGVCEWTKAAASHYGCGQ